MVKKIYASGNYIIKDDNGTILEYSKKNSFVTERSGDFVLFDETNKAGFTITLASAVNWADAADGLVAYTPATLRTFFRANTQL